MVKIDKQFLEEVGLAKMPEEKKAAFIAHVQEEFEVRVGERMSEGMTMAQLEEFDGIMKNDRGTMIKVLSRMGDYQKDEIYQKILNKYGLKEGTMAILGEYLSVKWIQENRPNYSEIVKKVAEELKAEVRGLSERILAANTV